MSDKTYNGWSNYATWRVNLEIFDGQSPEDVTGNMNAEVVALRVFVSDLADALKEQAEELIEAGSSEGLARDYAFAFLSDVNWREIAEGMADAYADERTEVEAA